MTTTTTNPADPVADIGHTKDDGIVLDFPGVRVILTPGQAIVFANRILLYVSQLKAYQSTRNEG
jgi:hypothetical protein